MKIGILTLFHGNKNWGGVLQGYALKSFIENNYSNACVEIICYKSSKNIIYNSRIKQALQYSPKEIIKIFGKKFFHSTNTHSIQKDLINRYKMFNEFEAPYKGMTLTDENLKERANDYDVLICGSDQIWNPNVSRPGFYLAMVGNECEKISYAASIARNDLSAYERKVMIPLIERFDYISVREKTAKKFLEKYTSKEIREVLDPALMLTSDEWSLIATDKIIKEKYVLAFFFSESIEYRKQIERVSEKQGFKIAFIPFAANKYIDSDLQGKCERLYDIGPKEFIRLFMDAEYVFTDSFHGSVFSILFKKNFIVFERDKNNKVSKNSRLYDLLEKFNLSNRLVRTVEQFDAIVKENVNFENVYELLQKYRRESKAFLDEAFEKSEVL